MKQENINLNLFQKHMEKYRQPDQFYIDQYDRDTVRQLKELENKEVKELEDLSGIDLWKQKLKHSMNQRGFHITGVWGEK